jgi:hypothetical protein
VGRAQALTKAEQIREILHVAKASSAAGSAPPGPAVANNRVPEGGSRSVRDPAAGSTATTTTAPATSPKFAGSSSGAAASERATPPSPRAASPPPPFPEDPSPVHADEGAAGFPPGRGGGYTAGGPSSLAPTGHGSRRGGGPGLSASCCARPTREQA